MLLNREKLLNVITTAPADDRYHVLVVIDDEYEIHQDIDLSLRPYPWPDGAPFAVLPDYSDSNVLAATLIDYHGDEWRYIEMSIDTDITAEQYAAHHYSDEWEATVQAQQSVMLTLTLARLNGQYAVETAVWGFLPGYVIAPPPCQFEIEGLDDD